MHAAHFEQKHKKKTLFISLKRQAQIIKGEQHDDEEHPHKYSGKQVRFVWVGCLHLIVIHVFTLKGLPIFVLVPLKGITI